MYIKRLDVFQVNIESTNSDVKAVRRLFIPIGGPGRNRTDVQGFAGLCITTLPPDLTDAPPADKAVHVLRDIRASLLTVKLRQKRQ